MDIGNLLPIGILILSLVMRKQNKANNQNKRGTKPKKTNHFPRIEDLNRMGDILKTKLVPPPPKTNEITEDVVVDKIPDEIVMDPLPHGETDFEQNRGAIYENEIGKDRLSFDRKSVRRGIIMSEVLGKPKSLRR